MIKSENSALSITKEKLVEQINVLVLRIEDIEATNTNLNNEVITRNNVIQHLQSEIRDLQKSNSADKHNISTLNLQCIQNECALAKYEQQILVLEHQLETSDLKNEKTQENVFEYQEKYIHSTANIREVEHELDNYKCLLVEAEDTVRHLEAVIEATYRNSDTKYASLMEYKEKLNLSEEHVKDLKSEMSAIEKENMKTHSRIVTIKETNKQLEQQTIDVQEQLVLSEEAVNTLLSKLNTYKQVHSFTNCQYRDLEELCIALQNTNSDVEEQNKAASRKLICTSMINKKLHEDVDYLLGQHTSCHSHQLTEMYQRC